MDSEKLKEIIDDEIDYSNLLHTLFYKYFGTEQEIKEMDKFIKEILEEDDKNEKENNN